jgi:hypothetical protein
MNIMSEAKRESRMPGAASRALLELFVINLGIAFGAGVYESRIVFPEWLSSSAESGLHWNAEAVRRHNTGLRFWVFVTTVPLTLLTLLNLVAGWRADGTLRRWWVAAGSGALLERTLTLFYFIPTLAGLTQALDSAESVATAAQWANLNHLRHAMVLTSWLAALKAFSLARHQPT